MNKRTSEQLGLIGKSALKLLLAVGLLCTSLVSMAQFTAPDYNPNAWETNGSVLSMAQYGNTLYLGGSFDYVGPHTGSAVSFSSTTAQVLSSTLDVKGWILTSIPDGSGGWYIGGNFTMINGLPAKNLAHITSTYGFDQTFSPVLDGEVKSIAKIGTKVYVSGNFWDNDQQQPYFFAELDATTGQPTNVDYSVDNFANCMIAVGDLLYMGGVFSSVMQEPRSHFAVIDVANYMLMPFDPSPNNEVTTMLIDGTTIYIGGLFTSIGSNGPSYLASFNRTTGTRNGFNVNVNNGVSSLAKSGNTLYVGGYFTAVNGSTPRNYLAQVNATTGTATTWDAQMGDVVRAMALNGSNLYVSGNFRSIGASARHQFAAIDVATALPTSLNLNTGSVVLTIQFSGSNVFIGGEFSSFGGVMRERLAALDITTGQPTSWQVTANNDVRVMLVVGDKLYMGGYFDVLNGQVRRGLASIELATGQLTSFDGHTGAVDALELVGNTLYVGGGYTLLRGVSRKNLGAIDLTTGQATSFDPKPNGGISSLKAHNGKLYAAGFYFFMDTTPREQIASFDIATGALDNWSLNPDGPVNQLLIHGNLLYMAGNYQNIGGLSRRYISALDLTTRQMSNWDAQSNGGVTAMAVANNVLYMGTGPGTIAGVHREYAAALDPTTAQLLSWDPSPDYLVASIVTQNNQVILGGYFSRLSTNGRANLAFLSGASNCTPPATPTITAGGPTTFCTGGSVTLTAPAGFSYLWSTGATTQSINVTTSGSYTVQTIQGVCSSAVSAATVVTVNTAPSTPTITASGSTTFCAGGSVILQGPLASNYIWSNGATTQNTLITQAGTYTLRTHLNGCTSDVSNAIVVTIDAAPSTPTITASGSTTFCAGGSVILQGPLASNYIWSNGATTQNTLITQAGTYTLRTHLNGCTSDVSNAIVVTVDAAPSTPTITASGSTTFCSGGSVILQGPLASNYIWSNGATTQNTLITQAGTYTLRTHLNGCTSDVSNAIVVTVDAAPSTPTITASGSTNFCDGGSVILQGPLASNYIWSNGATTQNTLITQAGTYTLRTHLNGCTSDVSNAIVVTVGSAPSTPTITASGPTSFCSGGSVILQGPLASNYIWSNGATTQNTLITQAGTYTLRTHLNGCTSDVSNAIVVTVGSAPSTPTITASGPTSFCEGDEVVLSGPVAAGYLWSTGATTQQITVSQPGNYTLQLVAGGCSSAVSNQVTVSWLPCRLKRFTGTGNWTSTANWNDNTLPVATDTVAVMPLANLTMNTTATVRSLTVVAGATMVMNTTSDLTVTNVANNQGTVTNVYGLTGTLRLGGGAFPAQFRGNKWSANRVILLSNVTAQAEMDIFATLDLNGKTFNVNNRPITLRFGGPSSHTAELLQPAGSAMTNANTFRVDRRYPIALSTTGASGGAWLLVGAPVGNQNVLTWNQGNAYSFSWQNGIYNGGSIYTYDPFYTLPLSKGYKKPVGPSQTAPLGVAHRVWFSRSLFFTGPNQGGQSYVGTPHIGSFNWNLAYCATGCADTVPPTTHNGYNMIANPYAATIDWDAPTGWTRNNVFNAYYITRSATQNVASYVNGVGNNGGTRYLPVAQGFFVWANTAGASITLTPEAIVPGQQVAHRRTGQIADVLRLNVLSADGLSDEAVIRFDQRATPLFDDLLEARKMNNQSGLNFAFVNANNERIAINAENLPATQTSYPLSVAVPADGNYMIMFDGMATLTNNWSVYLKDNVFNALIPVQDGQGYSFNEQRGTTNRFSLVVMPQGPTSLGSQTKLMLNIVPNPARDVVRVNFSQATNGLLTVTNQIGQVVMSHEVNGTSHELNVGTLAKGIYHVAVGGVVTKLVVE